MDQIKPRKLSYDFIRAQAEKFRQKYVEPINKIPVPIIEIVEIQLQITPIPIPGLLYQIDVDGFLSNDLENLYIDQSIYDDDRYENRLRFTYAHELGHLILHREEIQQCKFRNADDWIDFREEMQENDLFFFEQQAYEFAGRLLVPRDVLIEEIFYLKDQIDQFRSNVGDNNDEMIKEAISRIICDKFKVSEGVISRRIRNEKITL